MVIYGGVMHRGFELEVREARRIIREHDDTPDDFTFTRTPKRAPGGPFRIRREYAVTVSRGKVPPMTYEGGPGRNWVVHFAHDLAMRRFSEVVNNNEVP